MPLNPNAVLTLEDAKEHLKVDDTEHDSLFEDWINFVSGWIEDIAENKFVRQAVEEVLNGSGTDVMMPRYFPVIGLAGADDNEKLQNLQYRLSATSGWVNLVPDIKLFFVEDTYKVRLLDGYTFPTGVANIRIKYEAGYDVVPGRISIIAREMLQMLYNEARLFNNWLGKASLGESGSGANYNTALKNLKPEWIAEIRRLGGKIV